MKTLKKLQKGISEIVLGPSKWKLLRNAIENNNEIEAIRIILSFDNTSGNSNNIFLPSMNFPSLKDPISFQTPFHLACKYAMKDLIKLCLEKQANPNTLNGRNETAIHALCSNSSNAFERRELLDILLEWKSDSIDFVTIHYVDIDGNSALHYAAANGLLSCVEKFVELNAILSLVNKLQMTCCEMADEAGFKDLASMLEIAMVFQPENDIYDEESSVSPISIQDNHSLFPKCNSLTIGSQMEQYISYCIIDVYEYIQLIHANVSHLFPKERIEVLLNQYAWDMNKLKIDLSRDINYIIESIKFHNTVTSNIYTSYSSQCEICQEDITSPSLYPNGSILSSFVCPSGHVYCVSCWSSHLSVQVKDNGGYALTCPAYKCLEIIHGGNLWVHSLFDEETKTQYFIQRAKHVIDCSSKNMKWCPKLDCNAIFCLPISTDSINNIQFQTPIKNSNENKEEKISEELCQSLICHNGHCICKSCSLDSHTPSSCEEWKLWIDRVTEEIKVCSLLHL